MRATLVAAGRLVEREAAGRLARRVHPVTRRGRQVVPDARDVDIDAVDLEPRRGAHGVGDPLAEERGQLGDVDADTDDEREDDADLALAQVDAYAAHADREAEEASDPFPDREAAELDDAGGL